MDCICGCGTRLGRELTDVNFRAGEVGLELLAWDKARMSLDPSCADAATVERIVAGGARCYQECLVALHGDLPIEPSAAADEWLAQSRRERRTMARDRSFVPKGKIKLSQDDFDRFDRHRPERSFTGGRRAAVAERDRFEPAAPAAERADEDPVAQLNGLRELHAAGALTDEEFATAKARVIARLG